MTDKHAKPAANGAKPFDPQTDPIGIALRKVHDSIVAEPIPDEFLELLSRLDDGVEGPGKKP